MAKAKTKAPVTKTAAPKKAAEAESTTVLVYAPSHAVSANSSLVDYPQDQYGLTSDLKTAIKELASRINGHPDKKAIADAVLSVSLAHLQAKYEQDNAQLVARTEAAKDL